VTDSTTNAHTLIVFGASGDLAARLLLPGLGTFLASDRAVPVQLIGTGRSDHSADFPNTVREAFASVDAAGEGVQATLDGATYLAGDPTDPKHLEALFAAAEHEPVLYFALPPAIASKICDALAEIELPESTILAFEKPFGADLEQARALNRKVLSLVPEERVHRTDHFLGRTTVLNLLGLRFGNRVFQHVWNADNISSVDVVYDESLALEGRAQYYDGAGALVDMVQSHLLQLLAVVAMDPPIRVDSLELRDKIAEVLRATSLADGNPASSSRRARYVAGELNGKHVPAYADEEGVDASRETETLAEVMMRVDTARFHGVPFRLRSGKALGDQRKQIVVRFRPVTHLPAGLDGDPQPDELRITISPERLELTVTANGGGDPFEIKQMSLATDFAAGEMTPYGEVLSGIFHDDPLLSIRGDVAERCWEILQPVIDAWKAGDVPLDEYEAGSAGPTSWVR
jgi:glucose-6-phosphate 1-dehydrogenase